MRSLLGTVIWVVGFFCFITLSMSCHSLLAWRVLLKDQLLSLCGSPCELFVVFPLLLLIFVLCVWSSLIWLIRVLGILPWVYPVWDSLGFFDLDGSYLPRFKEVFNYYLLKYFLMAFLFVFFFWDSYHWNVGAFDIVPEVSEVVLISFNSFFFSCLFHLFPPFYLPPHLSCLLLLLILLLVPSRVLLISAICNSILFSGSWIIFTVIILNSFSGGLPISSSFVWVGGLLSCSFTCWIFLCLFILFRLLCLGWSFCLLEVCSSSLLWRFLPVSGVGRVASQDFLVREACMSVLVGRAWSLLSGVQWSGWISSIRSAVKCPVVSFEVSVGLVWLLTACNFVLCVMFLHCWRISLVCMFWNLLALGCSLVSV